MSYHRAGPGVLSRLEVANGQATFIVEDDGVGLPEKDRDRLTEPYVTTREKGTGLGLAIVGRILEEHGGAIELRDASDKFSGERGAWVRLRIASNPIVETAEAEKQKVAGER